MRLPTFLIIGSQKAGTTSLYHVLSRHPQIFMPQKKELHLYKRSMAEYRRHFRNGGEGRIAVGEATPVYICHPEAPNLIRKHLPETQLILTVRNPVDRAYSHYWDQRRHMLEWLTFEEAVEVALTDTYVPGERGYFSRGFYHTYIERYLQRFGRDRLLVLFFDDLIERPRELYRQCFRFLNVDDSFECAEMGERFNPSTIWDNPLYRYYFHHPGQLGRLPEALRRGLCFGPKKRYRYPPMERATRARLVEFFAEPNRLLAAFAGRSLEHWNA